MNRKEFEQEFIDKVMDAQGIVHKVCGMYCDDEEDRKDLFQDILINLWKSYPSFRGDSKFSTWMYRVSLNVAIQRLRKSNKEKEDATQPIDLDAMASPPEENLPEKELQMMHTAIEQLSDVEKAIVMLYLDEKGNEEIAEVMGISQNYVRVKMTRIREKLKKMVEA
ncbi:MAG: sigma-70 family RNA polymerase sigma factor [Balneolaceae bacterium]|nr:sigma-70 family RNA polymerase sigma factor [Balneolaceae bacterium]